MPYNEQLIPKSPEKSPPGRIEDHPRCPDLIRRHLISILGGEIIYEDLIDRRVCFFSGGQAQTGVIKSCEVSGSGKFLFHVLPDVPIYQFDSYGLGVKRNILLNVGQANLEKANSIKIVS